MSLQKGESIFCLEREAKIIVTAQAPFVLIW